MWDLILYLNDHYILYFLCISMLIVLLTASRLKRRDNNLLLLIVLSILALSIFEFLETLFNDNQYITPNFPRYLFASLCYMLMPTIIVLFYHMIIEFKSKKYYFIWSGVILNAIIYLLALFAYINPNMRFVFWYNDENILEKAILGYSVNVICSLYLIALITISIIELIKKKKNQANYIIIFTVGMFVLAQVIGILLQIRQPQTTEALAIGALLYFIYLSYEKSKEDAITYERDVQEKTTALMLSQIKPHFIYNTLATIQVLCEIDPEKASKTIEDFSKYLRMNTDALSKREPVAVTEEIKHAKVYSSIEMLRFDNIKVEFDILDEDFKLPVLTIEPMLENAIKYGIRARKDGLVKVMTYKEGNNHILVIKDNGVGFDLDKLNNDEKVHVGIDNVKTRIKNMVNGSFEITSVINEGTTITIKIPEVTNEGNMS